jgi:hypothetical protein
MKRLLAILGLVLLLLPGCGLLDSDSRKGDNEGGNNEPEARLDARPAAPGYA